MKHGVVILIGLVLAACGGGGGGDDEADTGIRGWVRILEPIDGSGTFSTRASSIEISGNAFVSPADADCATVQPVQLTLTWRNESSGQSGSGSIRSFCQTTFLGFQRVSSWIIPEGDIDLQFGDNAIQITAADNVGNSGTATLNVIREEDLVRPVIVNRSPAPASLDAPVNVSITVTFSEAMRQGSLTDERFTVTDPDGTAISGLRSYDPASFRWEFEPEFNLLYSAEYTVTISGLVEDAIGGNTLGTDVSWNFTTAPNLDVTPPQVTEVSPDPGSACVAPDTNVLATLDEPLDASTVNNTTFTLVEAGSTAIDAAVSYDGATAVLDPLLPLIAGTGYEARLSTGVTDLAGNALGADFAWSFTTANTIAVGSWSQTSSAGAPFERRDHTAIWNGSEVVVYGGHGFDPSIGVFVDTNTGGRYDPFLDVWGPMNKAGAPVLSEHSAVFTGTEMIVWGGNTDTGARYEPGTDSWQPTSSTNAPSPRRKHAAVWTGTEMIVWGGATPGNLALNTGGRYDPMTDTWAPISTENAPAPRVDMAYTWTGTELIVWGGVDSPVVGSRLSDGARYNPVSDTWTPMSTFVTVNGLGDAQAVWTGTEVIIWDGGRPSFVNGDGSVVHTPTLRFYDPATDLWRATANACEPFLGVGDFEAHWTGAQLFVSSNSENGSYFYDPASDSWGAAETLGGPPTRSGTASVWTGDRFVLWGGQEPSGLQDTGFVFQE